jgi:hypothetical protein
MLDAVKAHLTPELIGKAANMYAETELGITKTIHSLVPTILIGLLEKSGDSHAIDGLFNALKNFDSPAKATLDLLLLAENHSNNGVVGVFLGTLFGAKAPAISNAVAAFAGVKQSTVTALLPLAGTLSMHLLQQKIAEEQLNPSGMVRYLLAQKNILLSLVPAGVAPLLGVSNAAGQFYRPESSSSLPQWLWIVLGILGLATVILLGLQFF